MLYARIFIFALCLLPLAGIAAPRALSFLPALIGVTGFIAFRPVFGRWPSPVKSAFVWTLAITALMALSSLWAIEPSHAFSRSIKTLPVLLGGALLLSLAWELGGDALALFKKYYPVFLLAGALLCVTGLYFDAPFYDVIRGSAEMGNLSPLNRSVVTFVLLFFTGLALLPLRSFFAISLIALLGAVCLATHSQSAQLAIGIGMIFYFLYPARSRIAWVALAGLLGIAILAAPFLSQWFYSTFASASQDFALLNHGYAAQRLEIWDFISRYALQNPLLGYGVEAAREINDFDAPEIYYPSTHILHPHNFAIQVWIEFGLLGAVTAAGFISFILWSVYKKGLPAAKAFLPVFFAAISAAATGYGLWQGWWLGLFTTLAALSVLAFRAASLEESSTE